MGPPVRYPPDLLFQDSGVPLNGIDQSQGRLHFVPEIHIVLPGKHEFGYAEWISNCILKDLPLGIGPQGFLFLDSRLPSCSIKSSILL